MVHNTAHHCTLPECCSIGNGSARVPCQSCFLPVFLSILLVEVDIDGHMIVLFSLLVVQTQMPALGLFKLLVSLCQVFGACCWTKACLSDVKDGVWVLTSLGTDSTPAKWVGTNDKWVAVDKVRRDKLVTLLQLSSVSTTAHDLLPSPLHH